MTWADPKVWFPIFLALCGIVPVVMSFLFMTNAKLAIRKRIAEIVALSIVVPALVFMLGAKMVDADVVIGIIGTIAGYFFGHSFSSSDGSGKAPSSKDTKDTQ